MTPPDLGQYCRSIETHLCQVNHGHLVRVVGPAFDMVRRWHTDGVPLKIALRGIDRRAERAAKVASSSRRPLRLEFCEPDVLDVLDEWRRAIGFAVAPGGGEAPAEGTPGGDAPGEAGDEEVQAGGRTASLPKHLERVAVRLTSFAASASSAGPELHALVSAMLDAVEALRSRGRVRGEARAAVVEELERLDARLSEGLLVEAPSDWLDEARAEAREDLAAYASRVPPAEFSRLVDRAAQRLLRSRLQLPDMRLE